MDEEKFPAIGSLNTDARSSLLMVHPTAQVQEEESKSPTTPTKKRFVRNRWWEPELPKAWPPSPVLLTCVHCQETGETATEMQITATSWCFSAFLCFTFFWICAWIPLCVNRCNVVHHRCSHCKVSLGTYDPYNSDK